MDDPSIPAGSLGEGFPGERMRVLPAPIIASARAQPGTSQLLVTDAGYFPHASAHARSRPHGTDATVLIVCQSGAGRCTLAERTHTITAGDAVVLPPGVPHTYVADRDDPWTIWWLHLLGTGVADLVAATGTTAQAPVLRLSARRRVTALLDVVLRSMEHDETQASLLTAAGAAWNAVALLASDRDRPTVDRDPVEVTIDVIRDNMAQRLPVAQLAAIAGISPSHYAVLFRRRTGFGVLEYQTRLRMSRARELLDTTTLPIAEVARAVGFDDPLYFSRQFRRYHLTGPRAYRNRESAHEA